MNTEQPGDRARDEYQRDDRPHSPDCIRIAHDHGPHCEYDCPTCKTPLPSRQVRVWIEVDPDVKGKVKITETDGYGMSSIRFTPDALPGLLASIRVYMDQTRPKPEPTPMSMGCNHRRLIEVTALADGPFDRYHCQECGSTFVVQTRRYVPQDYITFDHGSQRDGPSWTAEDQATFGQGEDDEG